MSEISKIRNVAIIAHVDHGKTTLVDRLLQQSGTLGDRFGAVDRVMDSNDLERERGITIQAKNTAITWQGYHINIVDTPGHADFGGEVERVLSMVDAVLLLVDAVEGPMPQTRFVTQKAFSHGLCPIVVVNKIDRDAARPDFVLDATFDLFDSLGANEQQLDFPVVYASAIQGYASNTATEKHDDMAILFQTIIDHVPPPDVDQVGGFQMQISSLAYSSFLGAIGIGRVQRGSLTENSRVAVVDHEGKQRQARLLKVFGFTGLERVEQNSCSAGEIVAISGIDGLGISDTICSPDDVAALPALTVDEPTVSVIMSINDSPYSGREGKYLTARQIQERLERELIHNVALRVDDTGDPERFAVAGRGELHLGILFETMRREGYEFSVSRPEVIKREIDGQTCEPWEQVTVDIDTENQGAVMQALGERRGNIQDMNNDGRGRTRLDYLVPSRGLIGFQTEFMTMTSGTGLLHHVFEHYAPVLGDVPTRPSGVLISNSTGKAVGFALWNLQERGRLFVGPGEEVYEGQVIGYHSRDNDLVVNPLKAKQLSNVRASGRDENINLTPHMPITLERGLEMVDDDELLEITPHNVRLRKRFLSESDRKRRSRLAS